MPDLLGAANPVPGYDKTISTRNVPVSQEKVQIQNSPDLSRVSRADRRTEWQESNQQQSGNVRYDSSFQTFIQRLRDSGSITDELARILSWKEGSVVLSGMGEGTAEEISKMFQLLQMDQQQLLDFLTGQIRSGNRFHGALFSLLRNAYAKAASTGVQNDILNFLKAYSDFASSNHIENNMLRNLNRMADAMPASWAERLRDMIAQLENSFSSGDRQGSLQLLQKGVILYMANYTEKTHDMGLPRTLLSMLTLDVARYQNGSPENMIDLFHQLSGYGTLKGQLGGIDEQSLLKLLERSRVDQNSTATQFADHLTELASKAMRSGSAEMQQAFQNLIQAMLINESVYMPLNHYLIPLQWDDKMLFSELWVDPNDENGNGGREGTGKAVKVLLKMDVQTLGLFDVLLSNYEDAVELQIYCPERVAPFSKQIEEAIKGILVKNEFRPVGVTVRKMERPVTLTEVFPKIFEGKNSVDVKI